jgi:hypothetical protein
MRGPEATLETVGVYTTKHCLVHEAMVWHCRLLRWSAATMRVGDWVNEVKNLCIRQDGQSKAESQELTRTVIHCKQSSHGTARRRRAQLLLTISVNDYYTWFHLSPKHGQGKHHFKGEPLVTAACFHQRFGVKKGGRHTCIPLESGALGVACSLGCKPSLVPNWRSGFSSDALMAQDTGRNNSHTASHFTWTWCVL